MLLLKHRLYDTLCIIHSTLVIINNYCRVLSTVHCTGYSCSLIICWLLSVTLKYIWPTLLWTFETLGPCKDTLLGRSC